MPTSEILLFDFGTDGGGATVFKLLNNKVVERGSSGGILDEEEDPIKKREKIYESWEDWWASFTNKHKTRWINFYPLFIHSDIKPMIKAAIDNFQITDSNLSYLKDNWLEKLA